MRTQSFRDQGIRYLFASGLSAGLSFILPIILHEAFGIPQTRAVLIGLVAVFCLNFFTTRRMVFRSSGGGRADLVRYVATSLSFRVVEFALFSAINGMLGLNYIVIWGAVLCTSAVTKFVVYRRFVYVSQHPHTGRHEQAV